MALMPVEEALARILKGVKPLAAESISLRHAHGRILAKPVHATRDQPPFDASAMDGYAIRNADLNAAASSFRIIGTSAAGHAFKGKLKPGEAVRILTGAPLPSGADTIVIQENTLRDGQHLTVLELSPRGKHIRHRSLDFARGKVLLPAGTKLNARDVGLAASGNAATVWVHKKPNVALIATGDELVQPGQSPRADQIVSSNSHALEAMMQHWGARVSNFGIIRDNLRATTRAVEKALNADIVVTTGGASVGDHDFVQEAFKACGIAIGFWKIALRPGKPLMFGTKRKTRILGLPGNPVSALVCSRIFLKPLIDAMLGTTGNVPAATAALSTPLAANDGRKDYIRATLIWQEDGRRTVAPFAKQDSSMQRALRNADCLIIRNPDAPAAAIGENVEILLLDF